MPKKTLHDQINEEIEASIKARLDLREALASFSATLDQIRDHFQQNKVDDLNARMQPEDKKESLP
jgi:hypothetical protein